MVLSVDGALVKRPEVQAYWRKHYQVAFERRMEGSDGECLISGCHGVIAPTHEKIKGMSSLGGQASGVSLMSFEKEAFRPMVGSRTKQSGFAGPPMAYVLALNGPVADHDGARSGPGRPARHRGCRLCLLLRDTDASTLGYDVIPKHRSSAGSSALQSEGGPPAQPFLSRRSLRQWRRLRVRYWVDLSLPVKSNLKTA